MSVDCTLYIGYTVNLKNNLNAEDWDFFDDFDGYSRCDCEGEVILLLDGMGSSYARIIFVDKKIDDVWDCDDYYKLRAENIPNDVYNEMNKLYMDMYGKELDKELIEYGLIVHFS
jgi:hypothetical protein